MLAEGAPAFQESADSSTVSLDKGRYWNMGFEERDGETTADTAVAASSRTEAPWENRRLLLVLCGRQLRPLEEDAGHLERERAGWLLAVQEKQWSILGAKLDGHGSVVPQRVRAVEPAVVVAATAAPLLYS